MMKTARFIFVFGLLSLVFCLFTVSVFAQSEKPTISAQSSYQTNRNTSPNTNPNVPNNLHNWTQNVMIEVMLALTCQLVGVDPTQPNGQCLGVDPTTGKIGFLPAGNLEKGQIGGAIGGMNNMISMLYTSPIHTSDYFQNLAANFGIVKNANAQVTGTGFEGLKPLLNLWEAFRNIVYLLFVIVFVAIGLAIMLRIKVDPRTVMSIQNQIPKIIIGIILVTFSFAIAGFLVDLMWVVIYLVFGLISGISGDIASSVSSLNPASLQGDSPFGALGGKIWSITFDSSKGIASLFENLFPHPGKITTLILQALLGPIATLTLNIDKVVGAIAFVIILIAVLIALFRLWFSLIMAYINILLDVVLAPFWIVGALVPGSPISAVGWLRDLIANLAAFPTVIAMFLLGKVFVAAFGSKNATGQFVPPLIGNPADTDAIGALIGLGIILMTPNVVTMVKAALKAPKFEGGGIGASLRAGPAMFTGGFKTATGMYGAATYDPLTGEKFSSKGAEGIRIGRAGRFGRLFGRFVR